jgi:hypothetical protein
LLLVSIDICGKNTYMTSDLILKAMEENEKNVVVGTTTFNVPIPESEIKEGLSVKDIVKAMKEASKMQLFPPIEDVSSHYLK